MPPIDFVPYARRNKYAGMAPLDREIWERFIDANPSAFDAVAYNVHIGEGTPLDTVVNRETGGDINPLYQKKIDVLGKTNAGFVIVEIGPRAATGKIGQVKGYRSVFVRDFKPAQPVKAIVLTDILMPDVEFVGKEEGVEIIIA